MSTIRLITLALLFTLGAASAHAFSLVDSNGRTHTLEQYRGQWVLVNFWATWCPPCLEEMPDLNALHTNRDNNLVVLGIAMDYTDPKTVLDFARRLQIKFPIILGSREIAAQIGRVTGLPTSYLYNPQGRLVAYKVGALTRQTVENYIRARR